MSTATKERLVGAVADKIAAEAVRQQGSSATARLSRLNAAWKAGLPFLDEAGQVNMNLLLEVLGDGQQTGKNTSGNLVEQSGSTPDAPGSGSGGTVPSKEDGGGPPERQAGKDEGTVVGTGTAPVPVPDPISKPEPPRPGPGMGIPSGTESGGSGSTAPVPSPSNTQGQGSGARSNNDTLGGPTWGHVAAAGAGALAIGGPLAAWMLLSGDGDKTTDPNPPANEPPPVAAPAPEIPQAQPISPEELQRFRERSLYQWLEDEGGHLPPEENPREERTKFLPHVPSIAPYDMELDNE